jgi:N-acetyl-anhydromuramyl-L-alanine amidase AmpD
MRAHRSARALSCAAIISAAIVLIVVLRSPVERVARPPRWQDIAPSVPEHAWRWIVVHHSATSAGDSQGIDAYHHDSKGWDGIGYHFVIGNGDPMPIGRIEATFRWRTQRHGAHAGPKPEQRPYNQEGIGICVIGDYTSQEVDPFVMQRLSELCALLIERVPTLSVEGIIAHRDLKDTECPGTIDVKELKERVAQLVGSTSRGP